MRKRGFLTQINPLLKIIVCIASVGLAVVLHDIRAISVLAITLLALLFICVRINLRIFASLAIALVVFMTVSAWLRGFHTSFVSTLRLIAILLPTPLLAGTTSPFHLLKAIQAARLPSFIVLSLMLMWRFLPIIQQEAQRIVEANWLRGVNIANQPQQWFSGLLMPLIFRIVAYADDVTVGLETRGYDPQAGRSNSQPLQWQSKDTIFAISAVAIAAVAGYLEWVV